MDAELKRSKEILISLEANMFSDSIGQLKTLIETITDNLSNRLKDIKYYFTGLPKSVNDFYTDDLDEYLIKKLDSINYIDIRNKVVPIPVGFNGKYLDYANTLIMLVKDINMDVLPILNDYKILISSIINNGGDKILLKDYNTLYKLSVQKREKIDESLKKYVEGNKAVDNIGNLVHNVNEIKEGIKKCVTLIEVIQKENLIEINKDIEVIHGTLKILIEEINANKVVINKADILDIGNGAYEVAQYLESIALMYYSISVFLNRFKDLLVTIYKSK